jgi:hypothetical protein
MLNALVYCTWTIRTLLEQKTLYFSDEPSLVMVLIDAAAASAFEEMDQGDYDYDR